jgi:hypothetical protein
MAGDAVYKVANLVDQARGAGQPQIPAYGARYTAPSLLSPQVAAAVYRGRHLPPAPLPPPQGHQGPYVHEAFNKAAEEAAPSTPPAPLPIANGARPKPNALERRQEAQPPPKPQQQPEQQHMVNGHGQAATQYTPPAVASYTQPSHVSYTQPPQAPYVQPGIYQQPAGLNLGGLNGQMPTMTAAACAQPYTQLAAITPVQVSYTPQPVHPAVRPPTAAPLPSAASALPSVPPAVQLLFGHLMPGGARPRVSVPTAQPPQVLATHHQSGASHPTSFVQGLPGGSYAPHNAGLQAAVQPCTSSFQGSTSSTAAAPGLNSSYYPGSTPSGSAAMRSAGSSAVDNVASNTSAPVQPAGHTLPVAGHSQEKPWDCAVCTYMHLGAEAEFLSCAVCGAQRSTS